MAATVRRKRLRVENVVKKQAKRTWKCLVRFNPWCHGQWRISRAGSTAASTKERTETIRAKTTCWVDGGDSDVEGDWSRDADSTTCLYCFCDCVSLSRSPSRSSLDPCWDVHCARVWDWEDETAGISDRSLYSSCPMCDCQSLAIFVCRLRCRCRRNRMVWWQDVLLKEVSRSKRRLRTVWLWWWLLGGWMWLGCRTDWPSTQRSQRLSNDCRNAMVPTFWAIRQRCTSPPLQYTWQQERRMLCGTYICRDSRGCYKALLAQRVANSGMQCRSMSNSGKPSRSWSLQGTAMFLMCSMSEVVLQPRYPTSTTARAMETNTGVVSFAVSSNNSNAE